MRVQIVSDAHTEFHKDGGVGFIQYLNPKGAQVLVIAGDLALREGLRTVLKAACAKYLYVVMVAGNHEFYESSREKVQERLREIQEECPNLHVLEDSTVEIEGQRFIGSTLWFPEVTRAAPYKSELNDFHLIEGFESWVYVVNRRSQHFLRHNVQPNDVVITHHVPTPRGVLSYWRNHTLNDFYLCDMTETIWVKEPKLWVYGHTHDSHDFTFGKTRFACNPFGYLRRLENPNFEWDRVIDL